MQTTFTLPQSAIPTHWYNILPDMPTPMDPPLHPGTKQPVTLADMTRIFPENIVVQEMSPERFIPVPDEVRQAYALWRPTPLIRAVNLEKALDTPAHIYFKNEGVSPAGSHKPNSAVAQAYYNKLAGTKRLATETGAGQWGSSLAMACKLFGLECVVYQVKISYHQKPYRKMLMNTWGATVHASPSQNTHFGRKILHEDPDCPGSLGIAISEAIEDTVSTPNTKYALGSVLNHVCLHQTVIGQEALAQMELAGEYPDVVIGCAGGGSNFSGIAFPFVHGNLTKGKKTRIVAVEPSACPSLTQGELRYDFGDTAEMTPLMKMYTLGHTFMPPKIHAGGLRYHGMAPTVSHLYAHKLIEARAYDQHPCFDAALLFARTVGLVPAPESSHAVKAAVDEAIAAREEGKKRVILFNLSGHGLMDMTAYDAYLTHHLKEA
jgi:tryptophan synthase beta chain